MWMSRTKRNYIPSFVDNDGMSPWLNSVFELGSIDGSKTIGPRYDISEEENQYFISMEVPGVAKDDIDIELKQNILTIKGEVTKSDSDKKSYIKKGLIKRFSQSFSIPDRVDADPKKVIAHLDNGILTVILPISEDTRNSGIKIKVT